MKPKKLKDKSTALVSRPEKTKDIYERAIKEAIDRQLMSIKHASDLGQ